MKKSATGFTPVDKTQLSAEFKQAQHDLQHFLEAVHYADTSNGKVSIGLIESRDRDEVTGTVAPAGQIFVCFIVKQGDKDIVVPCFEWHAETKLKELLPFLENKSGRPGAASFPIQRPGSKEKDGSGPPIN